MAELNTPQTPPLRVELGRDDGVPVIQMAGELDLSTADTARLAMAPALEGSPPRVILDLGGLAFMDSSGIALLVSLTQAETVVEIRKPSRSIRRLLEVTGLTDTFRIVD